MICDKAQSAVLRKVSFPLDDLVLLRSWKTQAAAGRGGKATEGRLMSCHPVKGLLTAICGVQSQKQTAGSITCGRPRPVPRAGGN